MKFLLAISGGSDSMALWELFAQLAPNSYGVIHIQHHLRKEAEQEAKMIEALCQKRDVPFYRYDWTPSENNIEAKAREFRYACFQKTMQEEEYDILCTAHHRDDQIETIMQRIFRGTHLWHCTGIEELREFGEGYLWRPLLSFSKEELKTWLESQNQQYFEDESNTDLHYQRNRIRHYWIPQLEKENPQWKEQVLRYQEQLSLQNRWLKKSAKEIAKKREIKPQVWNLAQIEEDELTLFLWYIAETYFIEQGKLWNAQVEKELQKMCQEQSGTKQYLWQGMCFTRSYQQLSLQKEVLIQEKELTHLLSFESVVQLDAETYLYYGSQKPTKKTEDWESQVWAFPEEILQQQNLSVRHPKSGDKIKIGPESHQKLTRLFINAKIPQPLRQKQWVVTKEEKVLGVLGLKRGYLSNYQETGKINYIIYYQKNSKKKE